MPITKTMKGLPLDHLAAEGLIYHDICLTDCQRECTSRIGMTMQLEQEAYLTSHPEVRSLLELFVKRMTQMAKRKDILKEAGKYFTKPIEKLDRYIRERIGLSAEEPYTKADGRSYRFEDFDLINDLKGIILKHYPPEPWSISSSYVSTPNTLSSSFLSLVTSDTTIPTPEPVPTPEPTIFEAFYAMFSDIVDQAIYSHVTDSFLRYDTAYVEIMKCVEEAMEIPVIEIRKDIADLFYSAYTMFEKDILKKERIAAEREWEKRMRKKLKRSLRRLNNFKGYETPPTPKSVLSSHESYTKPPPPPCTCHPQFTFNRYPKDRFGIYLPLETNFNKASVTMTPIISVENLAEEPAAVNPDTKKK